MTGTPRATLVGGPTIVLHYAGLTIVTDPTFDPPGTYGSLEKTHGPAISRASIGPIDVVLLSHDQHADNLDHAGREMLAEATVVLSTTAAAGRIPAVKGLSRWEAVTVGEGAGAVTITAVPAQHGPKVLRLALGPATGFVLEAADWPTIYISGDNSSVAAARAVARRFPGIGAAVLFAGAAGVPASGPAKFTIDARRAIRIAHAMPGARIIPAHIDDWKHFREQREAFLAEFTRAGPAERLLVLERGRERALD